MNDPINVLTLFLFNIVLVNIPKTTLPKMGILDSRGNSRAAKPSTRAEAH